MTQNFYLQHIKYFLTLKKQSNEMASTSGGDKKTEKTPCAKLKLGASQTWRRTTYVYMSADLHSLCPELETFTGIVSEMTRLACLSLFWH